LRRELVPLRRGQLLQLESGQTTAAFARVTKEAAVIVALNNSEQAQSLRLALPEMLAGRSQWFERLAGAPRSATNDVLAINLPARGAVLLSSQPPLLASEPGKPEAPATLH
jgi:hypothetical protein